MRSARESAIRVLQLMMVASLVFPAVLFAFASWINYRNVHAVADERIQRSVDVLHEQALKVFQTGELAMAEVEALTEGQSDQQIQANEERLYHRLSQLVSAFPQMRIVALVARDGHALVSSRAYQGNGDVSNREYFLAQRDGHSEIFISDLHASRSDNTQTVFTLSKPRVAPDGSFNGVIAVSLRPDYFEDFYARIGRSAGSYYSLVREDGTFLARYPVQHNGPRGLGPESKLRQAIARGAEDGIFTVPAPTSEVDGIERRIGFRKIAGFPVYVQAGTETSVITAEWMSTMGSHLIFGLPITILLFGMMGFSVQRTRRLHTEAERREAAEVALRQSQRLEAIGQLTGGVAHDFNNLLMVVNGSVQRLRRELSEDKQVRLLDMITTASQRGESLTRQLLAFSRQQTLTPEVIDLKERLPALEDMLRRSLRGDIEIKSQVPKQVCAVKVDPSELELALLNVAVNARDAMPNGGTLTFTIRLVVLKGQAVEEGLVGEYVAIRITDTGNGIPSDVLPRVFEPFFTTKEFGKGTGLGLSQVYGFARQSGGTATITSRIGRGTSITLYLPRSRESTTLAKPAAEVDAQAAPAGTVLLVEDNAEVAEACAAYLGQLGYQAKGVSSGREALDALQGDDKFDIVFSDILMPGGMNGLELATAVRARYPRMPILLTTGYSASAQDAVRQNFIVVQKPYDLDTLRKSLDEARAWRDRREEAESARAMG